MAEKDIIKYTISNIDIYRHKNNYRNRDDCNNNVNQSISHERLKVDLKKKLQKQFKDQTQANLQNSNKMNFTDHLRQSLDLKITSGLWKIENIKCPSKTWNKCTHASY